MHLLWKFVNNSGQIKCIDVRLMWWCIICWLNNRNHMIHTFDVTCLHYVIGFIHSNAMWGRIKVFLNSFVSLFATMESTHRKIMLIE